MEIPLLRAGRTIRPLSRLPIRYACQCRSQSGTTPEVRRNYTSLSVQRPQHHYARTHRTGRPITSVQRRYRSDHSRNIASADAAIRKAQATSTAVFEKGSIPSEAESLDALQAIEYAARQLIDVHNQEVQESEDDSTPASALLTLDARSPPSLLSTSQPLNHTIDGLSNLAYRIVTHPAVFLTNAILSAYVSTQSLLLRPQTLSEIFDLYARKPAPSQSKSSSSTIKYTPQNPDAISGAVPPGVANTALTAALAVRNLPLALSIIDTTFRTRAFRRSKIFRQALPPLFGASLAPIAAYALASQLSLYQTALDPDSFTTIAFAGMFTYVAAVGTIGMVALTTANDQMERVTWAVGMPLRERWVREEERAAIDRIAASWGFREKWKWGEEEGEEWEALREWIGVRGMVLDKVGLMEGME